ncbi:hypothetical protein [Bradyrhizobium roseum]|uniref:hypothetical protein n=1 Tax=Bradyrhizobium roseum TaxID=3056648 RepID=UPI002610AE6B|nr:hypothetical protein [Bradyrhizobium roseus]WKA25680.1 hypothetical protein QUH67_18805 [Bradyrhizobium roseus]
MLKATAMLVVLTVLTSVDSHAQEAEGPAVDAKLSQIGDVTIIADTAKLVAQAQQEMSKDVDEKQRAREFKNIRLLRLRLNKRSLELRALLESFRQYKLSLASQLQQMQNSIQSGSSNKLQAELLGVEQERLKQQIEIKRTDLEALKKRSESISESEKRALSTEIAETELDLKQRQAQLPLFEQKKAELLSAGTTTQKEMDDLNGTLRKVDAVIALAQTTLRNLDQSLVEMDEQSNSLLQTEILSIGYTDRSTYIFAILVGAVIIGFFGVAFRSPKVQEAIFTGESGIQFITLFSLVIAIILFGVLKILEGKELAALLGGLSGYILGRHSAQRESGAAQDGAPVGGPATGVPAASSIGGTGTIKGT